MKKLTKIAVLTILFAFAQSANAQWTTTGSNVELDTPSNKVGIGVTPAFKLDVNGDINISSWKSYKINGDNILRTDSLGTVYLGTYAGPFNRGNFNTFLGRSSGANNDTGTWNTVVGHTALFENRSGKDNTVVGAGAGRYIKMNGNTAVGSNALHNNVGGSYNTAIGWSAGGGLGFGNETGQSNVFIGAFAGNANKDGNLNIYIGNSSANLPVMYDRTKNTFVGILTNLAGNENTVMGYKAEGTGSQNVLFGNNSEVKGTGNIQLGFLSESTGDYNITLGFLSKINAGDNNVCLGLQTENTGNNNVLLGNRTMTIGTITNGTALGSEAKVETDNTVVLGDFNQNTTTVIGNYGRFFGGVYKLELNGDAISIGGNWFPSDATFKREIKAFDNAMELINQLNPVTYFYKDDIYFISENGTKVRRNFSKEKQFGFLAQDLEKVIPEMVRTNVDGTKVVNYNQLFGVLTQGLKELSAINTENEKEIEELKEENNKLINMINDLNLRLSNLEQKSNVNSNINAPIVESRGKIEQVTPNPFNDIVVINYVINTNATTAKIVLRSEKSSENVSVDITKKGNGNVTLSGSGLPSGLYLCELYVDGQLVDSEKLILVK